MTCRPEELKSASLKIMRTKKYLLLPFIAVLLFFSGCGALEGMESRAMLAREAAVHPRDPKTGLLPNAGPIFIRGKGPRAALLIHGFGATPFDLKPLAVALSKENITVYAPLLPGHGTTIQDFARSTEKEWISASKQGLKRLARYPKVYIIGFSMGGAIALDIASEQSVKNKISGVVLLAPCVFIKGRHRLVTPECAIMHFSRFLFTDYIINKEPSFSFDKKALAGRPAYDLFPLKDLRELVMLEEAARRKLPAVSEPLLVVQSRNDPTVSASGPNYILSHISSKDKGVFWVTHSGHMLVLDAEKARIIKKVEEFIQSH